MAIGQIGRLAFLIAVHLAPLAGAASLRRSHGLGNGVIVQNVSTEGVAVASQNVSHPFFTGTSSLAKLHPYYHSTATIAAQLRDLATRCPGMTLHTESQGSLIGHSATVDVVTIKGSGAKAVNKNFILMGEHARELIGPETGLELVKALCGETALAAKAREALVDSEFQIVVNGNPKSRELVEQGNYCLRTNVNGVDLNRNWDENWDPNPNPASPKDTNPGPAPFSEPETQIYKRLVTAYDPTTFLTIHAGTYGMYMPWAFNMVDLADRNQKEMIEVLQDLDKDYCECPYGAAGKEVGYACPGTCLDWVYKVLKTPYAFAFEIYTSPQYAYGLKERWEEKISAAKNSTAYLQSGGANLASDHFKNIFETNPSNFVQRKATEQFYAELHPSECFAIFNPGTEAAFHTTVQNWVASYLDMAKMIAAKEKR
jgi:hypothetical protein